MLIKNKNSFIVFVGGLLVGLTFAKTLSQVNRIPFIGVNHLEGHALTARLANKVEYPFLLLLDCLYILRFLKKLR